MAALTEVVDRPIIGLTTPRRRRAAWVPPLLAAAIVMLLAGLWEGLVYLGLSLPAGHATLRENHGPLMVLGFLGTLIALERAVALGAAWAYLGPLGAALGGLAVVVALPDGVGQVLILLGGVVVVGIFVAVHRIQASLHNAVLASGAVCWVVAAALWLAGWDVPRFIPWLVGFLVLTITGERLELPRLVGITRLTRRLFMAAAGVVGVGLAISALAEAIGVRPAGVGLADGRAYDAMLYAIFLGSVISVIFAHSPVVVSAGAVTRCRTVHSFTSCCCCCTSFSRFRSSVMTPPAASIPGSGWAH